MPVNTFSNFTDSPMAPASRCFAIAPSDIAELPEVTKAIYVGTAGDVVLRALDAASDVSFKNVPAGAILDVRVRAIKATGTTASDIVGLA